MTIIIAILTTFLVIVSLLTILLIMIQDDQGEGFALFGSSGQNPFNTGKNPLARFTGYLGITFAVLAIATAFTISRSSTRNRLQQRVAEEQLLRDEDWFLQPSSNQGTGSDGILEEGAALEFSPDADQVDNPVSDDNAVTGAEDSEVIASDNNP